jgi:hypothetical protein
LNCRPQPFSSQPLSVPRDFADDGRALLLESHHTAKLVGECETRHIEILPLIPYTSGQIEPLDILTLDPMKQSFFESRFNQLANPQLNKVVRMPMRGLKPMLLIIMSRFSRLWS